MDWYYRLMIIYHIIKLASPATIVPLMSFPSAKTNPKIISINHVYVCSRTNQGIVLSQHLWLFWAQNKPRNHASLYLRYQETMCVCFQRRFEILCVKERLIFKRNAFLSFNILFSCQKWNLNDVKWHTFFIVFTLLHNKLYVKIDYIN